MKEIIHWGHFLDNYFAPLKPVIKKNEYPSGLTISYAKNNVYVYCDLSNDLLTINKLEFGRLTSDEQGKEEINWIKGVFIHDEPLCTTFLQTSFDSEYFDTKNNYTIPFNEENREKVAHFLKTPCSTGWIEEEYALDKDKYYKVIVSLGHLKWTIAIKSMAEQDLPFLTDSFEIWFRIKFADAFWNNRRRRIETIHIIPMNV